MLVLTNKYHFKVLNHLLVLCNGIPSVAEGAPTMALRIQERAVSSVCRELLKVGSNKVDKSIVKEYVKLLSTLSIQDIATPDKVILFLTIASSCNVLYSACSYLLGLCHG